MPDTFLYPYVRFLNASPSMGRASFFVNDQPFFTDFSFGEISGYKQIPSGQVVFRAVYNNGGDNIIYTTSANISNGDVLTLALAGGENTRTLLRIDDTTTRNDYKVANLRIVNLVSDFEGLNIYANGFPILDDIEFPEVSDYIFLRPDTYSFSIRDEENGNVILDTGNQTLAENKFYTLYIIGNAENEGMSVKAIFATDAMSYSGQYL